MIAFSGTDTGNSRETNQDACFVDMLYDKSCFAVVCDGMGGANGGNIASSMAVKTIAEYINNSYSSKMNKYSLMDMMKSALLSANLKIFDESKKNPLYSGMGTTVVVAIVRNGLALICYAGDSRAYLINNDIVQLTKDHSVVQTLLEDGTLTKEEAKNHPKKNIITKALGVEETLIPDMFELPIELNDSLLICTDGLSNYVESDEILRIVKSSQKEDIIQNLIDKANENGGGDNITAVIIKL